MPDERKALIYEESVRALDQQQAVLDNLRSRTGVLLAAASISSTFLGGQALATGKAISCWGWLAIVTFGVTGVLAIWVLVPRKNWFYSHSVTNLLENYASKAEWSTLEGMQTRLAELNQASWTENKEKLDRLFVFFAVACGALVLEIGSWLVDLGTG